MNANEDFFEAEPPIYRLQYTLEGNEPTRLINHLYPDYEEPPPIRCVKFSPSGQSIAVAGTDILKVWDAAGKVESDLDCDDIHICEVDWSKDGNLLVTSGEYLNIWNVNTGKCVKTLQQSGVFSAKFSPDDSLILAGEDDCMAKIWDVKSGVCLYTLSREQPVQGVDFYRDGTHFMVTSNDGYSCMYDLRSMDIVEDFTVENQAIIAAKFSPDSRYVLFSMQNSSLRVYDLRKQEVAGIYKGFKNNTFSCSSFSLASSGKYIISGSFANAVYIWDINTQEIVEVLRHSDSVECVDCHPEDDIIVSASLDNLIKIWKRS